MLLASGLLWLFAQYDGGRYVYEAGAALVGWPVPYGATGAFSFLAWQLLWMAGLYLGTRDRAATAPGGSSALLRYGAVGLAVAFFAWRHIAGQVPFPTGVGLNVLVDKWHLGPLRLLNFAVLAWLVAKSRPVIVALAANSSISTMGRSSLTVFSTHIVVVLALLATLGDAPKPHLSMFEIVLVLCTFLALYAAALTVQQAPRQLAAWLRAPRLRLSTRTAR
jgi:hypothetical protein